MMQDNETANRKKDHIDICLNEDVNYNFSNGFDRYRFEHNAITEVKLEDITVGTIFFGKEIDYPFLISCMTGGTGEAKAINQGLAEAAKELNIPIGVGSQRQMIESNDHLDSFSIFKEIAAGIPVLSNLGAAQVSRLKSIDPVLKIMDIVGADALVIHCNPLQELLQREGQPDFKGLLKAIEKIVGEVSRPVIVKEVGSGISRDAARKLMEVGVSGIDVAGSGGTSWAAVELVRNNEKDDIYFRNWGMPTSYCLRTINELRSEFDFTLISSGGVYTFDDIAKSIVLGADITASARSILKEFQKGGVKQVVNHVVGIFNDVKKIMYLTGSGTIKEFKKTKIIKVEEMY